MRNAELVLYPLKVHSASHTLEMLKYFKFCVPARQELTGHLRLLVWGARILEAQSCDSPGWLVRMFGDDSEFLIPEKHSLINMSLFAFVACPCHVGINDRFTNCRAPVASNSSGVVTWDCPGMLHMSITGNRTHKTSQPHRQALDRSVLRLSLVRVQLKLGAKIAFATMTVFLTLLYIWQYCISYNTVFITWLYFWNDCIYEMTVFLTLLYFWHGWIPDMIIFLTWLFFRHDCTPDITLFQKCLYCWHNWLFPLTIFLTWLYFWHDCISNMTIFLTYLYLWHYSISDITVFQTSLYLLLQCIFYLTIFLTWLYF